MDPVTSYKKLGWTITSPGHELDTINMLLTQTSSTDYDILCRLDVFWLEDSSTWDQGVVYEEFNEKLWRTRKDSTRPDFRGYKITLLCQVTKKRKPLQAWEPLWKAGFSDYHEIIQEQLETGVVEHAPDLLHGREFYIPHKGVIHESAESITLTHP